MPVIIVYAQYNIIYLLYTNKIQKKNMTKQIFLIWGISYYNTGNTYAKLALSFAREKFPEMYFRRLTESTRKTCGK